MTEWEWPQWLVVTMWCVSFLHNLMSDLGIIPIPKRQKGYQASARLILIAVSAFVLTKGRFF